MGRVTITLDFEHDDITDADVYNYLQELMDDGSLTYDSNSSEDDDCPEDEEDDE